MPAAARVEWNAHLFHSDVTRFPIHPRASYTPDVSRASKGMGGWGQELSAPTGDVVVDYAESLRLRGVDKCVVVHPEPYGDDHSVVEYVLDRRPDWLGTSLFYPQDEEAPSKLRELVARQPRIISTRFHAHRGKSEYLKSFAEPGVRALWRQAVELGLVVELHIGPAGDVDGDPPFGEQIADVLRDIPGSVVLIDHLAEAGKGTAPEFASILALARFPNVYMKLSGLGHFADDPPLYMSALPFTSQVIAAFGPDR